MTMTNLNDGITKIALKDVPKGEFFKRKADANRVYVRSAYDRAEKMFECDAWDDIGVTLYLKGRTMVFVGFTF